MAEPRHSPPWLSEAVKDPVDAAVAAPISLRAQRHLAGDGVACASALFSTGSSCVTASIVIVIGLPSGVGRVGEQDRRGLRFQSDRKRRRDSA